MGVFENPASPADRPHGGRAHQHPVQAGGVHPAGAAAGEHQPQLRAGGLAADRGVGERPLYAVCNPAALLMSACLCIPTPNVTSACLAHPQRSDARCLWHACPCAAEECPSSVMFATHFGQ